MCDYSVIKRHGETTRFNNIVLTWNWDVNDVKDKM